MERWGICDDCDDCDEERWCKRETKRATTHKHKNKQQHNKKRKTQTHKPKVLLGA
jgi:hypothetical protein